MTGQSGNLLATERITSYRGREASGGVAPWCEHRSRGRATCGDDRNIGSRESRRPTQEQPTGHRSFHGRVDHDPCVRFSLSSWCHRPRPAGVRGQFPTPPAAPRHPTPPRASGSSESSPSRLPSPGCTNRTRGPSLPNLRPSNPWRSLPRPKWSMRLRQSKASRRNLTGSNPPPGSGLASPIPLSGARSGALKPARSGRAACSCATAQRGKHHDTRRPTPGRFDTWATRDAAGRLWGVAPGSIYLAGFAIRTCGGRFDASNCGFGLPGWKRRQYQRSLQTAIEIENQQRWRGIMERNRAIRERRGAERHPKTDSIPGHSR